MESQKNLNKEILIITVKIITEFPELTKYLNEIPEHFITIGHEGINNKDLKGYLDSLNQLLETYAKEH